METTAEFIKLTSIAIFSIVIFKLANELYKEFANNQNKESNNIQIIEKSIIVQVVSIALFSRIIIFILGYMTDILLTNKYSNILTSMNKCWLRWDGLHYINIAQNWYQATGEDKYLIVFYPLYPILIKIANFSINNYFISGLIISNICLIISAVLLYKITLLDFDHDISMRSVKYLLIYPFSFFLSITYSDSLFLCLSLAIIYLIRQKKWVYAGILGGIASASRSFGVLLIVPALIEYLLATNIVEQIKQKNFLNIKSIINKSWFLFLFPIGLFIYYYICKTITGDWFISAKYLEEHWTTKFGFFPDTIKTLFLNSVTWGVLPISIFLWGTELLLAFLVLFAIFYSINRIRISYSAYMMVYWLLMFSLTWLLGAGRYTLGIFPIYILLGIISKNVILDFILTFSFTLLLYFNIISFIKGLFIT